MNGRLVTALLALLAAGVAIYLAGVIRERRSDIEALINATRETIPDHVPDEWTREHNQ